MKIEKSTGVNQAEELLVNWCEKTFLKLWSYPNPFQDDRDGKEMCDLLAISGNRACVFFVREANRFDELGEEPVPQEEWRKRWNRWKKETIDKQIKTAKGAERYLKSKRKIFLDKDRQTPLPITADRSKMVVHKIVVALGAEKACERYSEENLAGSLAIKYEAPKTKKPKQIHSPPFVVELDRGDSIHVFDSYNLGIILSELDTAADLLDYLDAKVEAAQLYKSFFYAGEEELLAHYFLNYDEKQRRYRIDIKQTGVDGVMIGEGLWRDFYQSRKYQARKRDNEVSYLWDRVIQDTCQNALDGTMIGSNIWFEKTSAIHEMAKESRLSRRVLSGQMLEAMMNFPVQDGFAQCFRRFMISPTLKTGYVFLQMKCRNRGDLEKDYRPFRHKLLEISCAAMRNKFDHIEKAVGIAIEAPKFSPERIEDFILMECTEWTDEKRKKYEEENKMFGFSGSGELFNARTYDFPDEPLPNLLQSARRRKLGCNDICLCGSGKKFKKCCGAKK